MKLNAITVRYIYSACIITETPDLRLLHDPWFSDGIYDGAWYQFPKIENPIETIGEVDAIYISHIHPDHYDPDFLKSYFKRYGKKQILIADYRWNHLEKKIKADGFAPTVVRQEIQIGKTTLNIIPHDTGGYSDIDSALVLKFNTRGRNHVLVNMNDIVYDDSITKKIKEIAGEIDILLCGFTGAGPYPQTYYQLEDTKLTEQAENKKQIFLERYQSLVRTMGARKNIPFAGKYLLGGRLAKLNGLRGVADPVEVLRVDKNAVVLEDRVGEINTKTLEANICRTKAYTQLAIDAKISDIQNAKFAYEAFVSDDAITNLPLKRLLRIAYKNAISRSEVHRDFYLLIALPNNERACMNVNAASNEEIKFVSLKATLPEPRYEINIDPRYLYGLLTLMFHWNNAAVGSHYQVRAVPEVKNWSDWYENIGIISFINYLTV
jgi:UDP-MurNAc hydroxylase